MPTTITFKSGFFEEPVHSITVLESLEEVEKVMNKKDAFNVGVFTREGYRGDEARICIAMNQVLYATPARNHVG